MRHLFLFLLATTGIISPLLACTADQPPTNKKGIHLLLDDGRNHWPTEQWAEQFEHTARIAGRNGYVTQLIRSDDLDHEKWQQFMDLCEMYHLTPIIRLATTFDQEKNWWVAPTADPNGRYQQTAAEYSHFLASLDWPTTPHYIIVGNEPNHGNEWSGQPDPAAYARFLVDMSRALHRQDPHAFVLNAGFDPYTPHTGDQPFGDGMWYVDAESFMDGMVQEEPTVFQQIDGWVSHPYPLGPFTAPPWEQTYQVDWLNGANLMHQPPPDGIYNRGINGYEWELWKLEQYGIAPLPIFITETGWRHSVAHYPTAETASFYFDLAYHGNKNGRYPNIPTEGWTPWLDDPRVVAITPFALAGSPAEWAHTSWLQVTTDGSITAQQVTHP